MAPPIDLKTRRGWSQVRDMLCKSLVVRGERVARDEFRKYHMMKRRYEIKGGMPPPAQVYDNEWAARWALHLLGLQGRRYEIGLSVDFAIHSDE